jgi:hypothetical protein
MRRYSDQELAKAVQRCRSVRAVLGELGVVPAGGNYDVVKKRIRELSLDTSHFTGQGYLRNKTHCYRTRPLAQLLVTGQPVQTYKLKTRLLREGLKEHRCESCGLAEWLGATIPLELHHRDGDRSNNDALNLQLLCPNCHALTGNYRGKKKKKV